MNPSDLQRLLEAVAAGSVAPAAAVEQLAELPYADLGFAKLDLHRELRVGLAEAVYAEGKQTLDLLRIVQRLIAAHGRALVTRLAPAAAAELMAALGPGATPSLAERSQAAPPVPSAGGAVYHERARVFTWGAPTPPTGPPIAVLAAGTSDLPVAEEAAVCAEWFGHPVERAYDVGVAGLHRLLGSLPEIRRAGVVIAVAGMDGALPTVVASLVRAPVVAVPTSVGYGTSFGGLAPLLTMLNGCAPGVGVVNIDNGYGAAVLASRIARHQP
jgi:pyridinium-3,5-biscarboxylic acid mononucleotide synthase